MPLVPARPWLRISLDLVHVALTAFAFCLIWTARDPGMGSVPDFLHEGVGWRMWELQLALAGFALMAAACLPLGGTRPEVVGCVGAAVTLIAWYFFAGGAIAFPIILITSLPYLVAVSLFGFPRYRSILARRRSRRRGFEVVGKQRA
jgi:hypothetical protein